MRKWREIHSLHFLIFSLFPPSLSISYIQNCHILWQASCAGLGSSYFPPLFSYFFHMCVGLERWCIPRGLIPLRPSCTKIHQHSSSASSLSSSSSSDEVRNSFRCIASISNYLSFLTLRSFQRGVFVVK